MSPKQQSTISNRNRKKIGTIGLIDKFLAFPSKYEIKIEPGINTQSKSGISRPQSHINTAVTYNESTILRTELEKNTIDYIEEETERDTSESDLTSDLNF